MAKVIIDTNPNGGVSICITTTNGTDVFDNGSINVLYE